LEDDPEPTRLPTEEEKVLVQALNNAIGAVTKSSGEDAYAGEYDSITEQYTNNLKVIADQFLTGSSTPAQCLVDCGAALGHREEQISNLERRQRFGVALRFDTGQAERPPIDMDINIPEGNLSQDQAELVIEVRKAVTVVSVVFVGRKPSLRQQQRHGEYIRKLYDIASAGLASPGGAAHALRALDAFREDFVSREASAVKNQYVRKLGHRAAAFAVLFLVLYLGAWVVASHPGTGIVEHFMPTLAPSIGGLFGDPLAKLFLLGIGASVGTWLSFSLRRPILKFDDLAVLEEDRLNPTARILFVVGLTLVVGLLLYTRLVAIKIGDIDVDLRMALLLGLLCGIAERALAAAVSQRASEVVERVGSKPIVPTTPAAVASPGQARAG
jgi:hypothetical protein